MSRIVTYPRRVIETKRDEKMPRLILFFLLVACASFQPSYAETVRHVFEGIITNLELPEDNPLYGKVQIGDRFSGYYEFDTNVLPGCDRAGELQCTWEYEIPPNKFYFSVNDISAYVPVRYIVRTNNGVESGGNPTDFYNVVGQDVNLDGWLAAVVIVLVDDTRTAIDDPTIQYIDPPNPDDFLTNRHQHFQVFKGDASGFLNGRLDKFVRAVQQVDIDIKPGSDSNPINPTSKGVIPVAILTTEDFDATTIDPLSIEFGPNGATETHNRGHIQDVNGDNFDDIVLYFRTHETGILCGDTEALITGQTVDGTLIEGSDSIRTVGCK